MKLQIGSLKSHQKRGFPTSLVLWMAQGFDCLYLIMPLSLFRLSIFEFLGSDNVQTGFFDLKIQNGIQSVVSLNNY